MSRILETVSEETKTHLAIATLQVTCCFDFDITAVTGKSGFISRRLLKAAGIPNDKIVHFNSSLNYDLYRNTSAELTPIRKSSLLRQLSEAGIDLTQKPRLLIVDEFIHTGTKAAGYIELLTKLDLPPFKFTTIVSRSNTLISQGEIPGVNTNRLFIPIYESTLAQDNALIFMQELVTRYNSSKTTLETIPDFKAKYAQRNAELVEKVLTELTETIHKKRQRQN